MKKIVLILGLLNSIIFTLTAQDAVISVEKFNILYLGMDNSIRIAVPNVSDDKIVVSIDNNGLIQKTGNSTYNVRAVRVGEVIITVEAGRISQKKFRAKQIPDPIPSVTSGVPSANRCGNKTPIERFRTSEGIFAQLVNFDIDARCSVQSFEIVISPQKGDIFRKTVIGPAFSEEIKNRFQKLQAGDTVTFLYIKSRCPGDEIARDLGSLSYIMQ